MDMAKRDLEIRSFLPIKLGLSKDQLKEESCIEATYDKD